MILQRESGINFKRLRFWLFIGALPVLSLLVGIIKQIIRLFS